MKQKSRESRLSRLAWLTKFLSTLVILVCSISSVHAQLEGQAVTTSLSGDDGVRTLIDGPVVRLIDVRNPPYTSANWHATKVSHQWTASNLGQVFGVAINSSNNDIYVTASTTYEVYDYTNQGFAFGPGGSAGVYKLNPLTGAITTVITTAPFNTASVIGTSTLPNGSTSQPGPGLGNICYDENHDKLFVTNFEDGKIYRINVSTGLIDDVYDPLSLDNGVVGYAPLGERPWGIAYNKNENRLYYGVWVKSIYDANTSTKNTIRSVALNSNGQMIGNDRLEIEIDNYHSNKSSGAISDISISYQNSGSKVLMAVASKAMNSRNHYRAHFSNAELYCGQSLNWNKETTYVVGDDSGYSATLYGKNSAGGIDFAYTDYDPILQNNSGCNDRVWITSDAMFNDPTIGGWLYGIHSSPTSGNNNGVVGNFKTIGHFIDFDNTAITTPGSDNTEDKHQIGDVEIFRACSKEIHNICQGGAACNKEYLCNGGFNDGLEPEWRNELNNQKTNNTWFAAAGGPDLFDSRYTNCLPDPLPDLGLCGISPADINCVGIPCNHFGKQAHRAATSSSVDRYAGLYFAGTIGNNPIENFTINTNAVGVNLDFLVEGIEQEMCFPLEKDKTYCIDFFASLAEKGEVDLLVLDAAYFVVKMSVGAKYSDGIIRTTLLADPLLPYTPTNADVIFEGKITDRTNWENVNHQFLAKKAYTHVIIESTYPVGMLDKIRGVLAGPLDVNTLEDSLKFQSYMYIDDISIKEAGCCGVVSGLEAEAGENKDRCSSSTYGTFIGGDPSASDGTAPYTYSWAPTAGLSNATIANPYARPTSTTIYNLTVTDALGNTASDMVTYNVDITSSTNLVPNGDFNMGSMADDRNQVARASSWKPATGSPDLFDYRTSCKSVAGNVLPNCVDVPKNYFGVENDHTSGSLGRYIGLYNVSSGNIIDKLVHRGDLPSSTVKYEELVEGVQVKLNESIERGMTYVLTCYAAVSDFGELSRIEVSSNPSVLADRVSINFKIAQGERYGVADYLPVNASSVKITSVDSKQWKKIEFCFNGVSGDHLIIESIRNASDLESYVYIDDVSIVKYCTPCTKSAQVFMDNEQIDKNTSVINSLNLFPNPTSGELNIQLNTDSEEAAYVQVFSLDAKLVSERQAVDLTNNGITTINLSHLPQGIYYVELVQGEQVIRERIVVQ
jgi:hypothetical protein